nr:TPA_asm: ND6 [Baikalogammarus pullus]
MTPFISLTLCYYLSIFFVLSKTPITSAFLVALHALLVAIYTYTAMLTSWYSFILVMVYIGAMMVIFAYVSSLASNDFLFLKISWPWLALSALAFLTSSFTLISSPGMLKTPLTHTNFSDPDLTSLSIYKTYGVYTLPLTVFLVLYLLIVLIVVAALTSNSKGPLKAHQI